MGLHLVLGVGRCGDTPAETATNLAFEEQLDEVAAPGYQGSQSDDVSHETGREKQNATDENNETIEDLFRREHGPCQLPLQAAQRQQPLGASQPGAGKSCGKHDADGGQNPKGVAHLNEQGELDDGYYGEQKEEFDEHKANIDVPDVDGKRKVSRLHLPQPFKMADARSMPPRK